MDTFQVLLDFFAARIPLTSDQAELLRDLFIPRHFDKGDFLIREGEVAKQGAFVAKGCLRSYVVDNQGREHLIQFAPETWWLTDIDSIMHGTPSKYFMDALEPTDVLLIDKPSHLRLMEELPGFAASFQKGFQKHTAVKDLRIIDTLTATAEERYRKFLDTYPSIAQRVPQHMIASYLGITPETLSRVRKKWTQKK